MNKQEQLSFKMQVYINVALDALNKARTELLTEAKTIDDSLESVIEQVEDIKLTLENS